VARRNELAFDRDQLVVTRASRATAAQRVFLIGLDEDQRSSGAADPR
jgi:hypothetical protein